MGHGLDAAQHFGRLNASKFIIAVRTESRSEVYKLDTSSAESVKAFADRVSRLDRPHGLVENAGLLTTEWKIEEGDESQIKVNVISTVMLALLFC